MLLCLDVGNTHIFGGVYVKKKLQQQFRYPSSSPCTSDQLGIFFKNVLRENDLDLKKVSSIAICSVVPTLNYSIRSAFLKYFSLDPFFLTVENTPKLKIKYKNPHEVGADRLSNALAAIDKFPDKNILVIDLGTATTVDAISKEPAYLGGVITPGMSISMKALYENTAKLPSVHILKPQKVIGQTTIANIQAGLYYGHLGALKEIISRMIAERFADEPPVIVGTGGFAQLLQKEKIFDAIVPELVLHGLLQTQL